MVKGNKGSQKLYDQRDPTFIGDQESGRTNSVNKYKLIIMNTDERQYVHSRDESFRKPNNNIQYTIVQKNPIQYIVQ